MMERKINIGIVGAGFMANTHMSAYLSIPNASVAGVVSRRSDVARELAQRSGGKGYASLEEMIENEKLDAVDVCLPTPLHKDAVLKSLEAGLDVIVEKPFALKLEDIDEMISASKRYGRRLMVAHVCRFMPEYIFAKAIIDEGELGKPIFLGLWRHSATPEWAQNDWLKDPSMSGGTITDLQIHDIDLSNWMLGNPKTFHAKEVRNNDIKGLSHVVSNCTYDSNAMSLIESGHIMPPSYPFTTGYRLVLEKGVVECCSRANEYKEITMVTKEGKKEISSLELKQMSYSDPYAEELSHFIECIINGTDFKISVEDARLAVSTAKNLLASVEKKAIIYS